MDTTERSRTRAVDAVRKFLVNEMDAVATYAAIVAFEDADSIDGTFANAFGDATGFDPDAVIDHDGGLVLDIDALMDLASDIEDYIIESRDPYDTVEEARLER